MLNFLKSRYEVIVSLVGMAMTIYVQVADPAGKDYLRFIIVSHFFIFKRYDE